MSPALTGRPFTTEPPEAPKLTDFCVYTHTLTHIHLHVHTHKRAHLCSHTHIHVHILTFTYSHSHLPTHSLKYTHLHLHTHIHLTHPLTVVCWNQPEPSHKRLLLNFQEFCEPVTQRSHYKSNNKHIIKQITLQIKLTNTQNSSLPNYFATLYYYLCSWSY